MQGYYLCDDRFSCTCRVAGYFRISFLNSVCRGGRDRMELAALATISFVAADLTYSWKRPKRVPDARGKLHFRLAGTGRISHVYDLAVSAIMVMDILS